MSIFILILHSFVTITLIGLILLQNSKGGLGGGLGAGQLYRSKRGAEKILFWGTILFAGLFLMTSIVNLVIG